MRVLAMMGTTSAPSAGPDRALLTAVWRALVVGVLVCGLAIGSGWLRTASAQDSGGPVAVDPTTCGHFETQEDAQAALDSGNLEHPEYLDGDGDGIACEDAFDGDEEPTGVGPATCADFDSQADAQAVLDTGLLEYPANLDGDGDGIACEDAFDDGSGESVGAVTLPSTGSGSAMMPSTSGLALLLAGMALTAASAGLAMRRWLPAGPGESGVAAGSVRLE